MSTTAIDSYDDFADYEDDIDEGLEDAQQDDERKERGAFLGGWGLSLALHGLVFLLIGLVVIAVKIVADPPPTRMAVIEPPPEPPEQPQEERELKEVTVEVDVAVEVESPVVSEIDLPVEEISTEEEEVSEVAEAKGREEAVSSSETGGSDAFMAIGAGGGAAGAFGNRFGGGKKRALGRFGGSKASESAVEAALRWFARHQSPDGRWDADSYPQNCTMDGPKCEPGEFDGSIVINRLQDKQTAFDIAITGYAVLCYLGAGYDHRTPNKYRRVVKGGLEWLVRQQKADGLLGESNYEHPIATMALVEAYGMTNDPALRGPCQKAVDIIVARQVQNDGYGLGWSYFDPHPGRMDSSVTGWNVMALKSAKVAGIDIGESLTGAKAWLEGAWEATNPKGKTLDPYTGRSGFPYTWNVESGAISRSNGPEDLTCVGALCAVFLGQTKGDIILDTLVNTLVEEQMQTKWPLETYYLYYSTLAVF